MKKESNSKAKNQTIWVKKAGKTEISILLIALAITCTKSSPIRDFHAHTRLTKAKKLKLNGFNFIDFSKANFTLLKALRVDQYKPNRLYSLVSSPDQNSDQARISFSEIDYSVPTSPRVAWSQHFTSLPKLWARDAKNAQEFIAFDKRDDILLNSSSEAKLVSLKVTKSLKVGFSQLNPFHIDRVDLVVDEYVYGVASMSKLGFIYNLDENRVTRVMRFNKELNQRFCGYVRTRRSIMCRIGFIDQPMSAEQSDYSIRGYRYLEVSVLELKHDYRFSASNLHRRDSNGPQGASASMNTTGIIDGATKIIYLNFNSEKPFDYPNGTLFGCSHFRALLQCQFYSFRDNSSSTFVIPNQKISAEARRSTSTYLPIIDLDILAIYNQRNHSINFYDLGSGGAFLLTFDLNLEGSISSDMLSLSAFDPFFDPNRLLMGWRIGSEKLIMFKFKPRFQLRGCKTINLFTKKCSTCSQRYKRGRVGEERGYCFPKRSKNGTSITGEIDGFGNFGGGMSAINFEKDNFLERRYWSLHTVDPFTDFKLKICFNNPQKDWGKDFFGDFKAQERIAFFDKNPNDLDKYAEFSVKKLFSKEKESSKGFQPCLLVRFRFKDSLKRREIKVVIVNPNSTTSPKNDRNSRRRRRELYEKVNHTKSFNFYQEYSKFAHKFQVPIILRFESLFKKEVVKNSSLVFFKVCGLLKLFISILLIIKIFIKNFQGVIPAQWLFVGVLKFQALSYLAYLSVYCLNFLDNFQIEILKIFYESVFISMNNPLFGRFYYGKYSEISKQLKKYRFFTLLKKFEFFGFEENLEAQVYLLILLVNLFFMVLGYKRVTKFLSEIRLTVGLLTVLNQCVWSFFQLNLLIDQRVILSNWPIYLKSAITLSIPFLMILDILISFSSPLIPFKNKRGTYLFPSRICGFYTFSQKIFLASNEIRLLYKRVQLSALWQFLRWPALILIFSVSHSGQILSSFLLTIWAFFGLFVIVNLTLGAQGGSGMKVFHQVGFLILRFSQEFLWLFYAFFMILFAFEAKYGIIRLNWSAPLSLISLILYTLLWVENLFFIVYVLILVAYEAPLWRVTPKECNYIVKKSPENRRQNGSEEANPAFNETYQEYLCRKRLKEMSPYDFWALVKMSRAQGLSFRNLNRSQSSYYVQTPGRGSLNCHSLHNHNNALRRERFKRAQTQVNLRENRARETQRRAQSISNQQFGLNEGVVDSQGME